MSRWIDAEKEITELKTMKVEGEPFTTAVNFAIITLEKAPSIDLVFCEECIHSDWHKDINGEWRCYCIEHGSGGHKADDFCSYGCRKENE